MIEFATLLLGLVVGPRQVEMAVQGPVAAIEVRLDGHLVHLLEREPWVAEVDFGVRLEPHRLTAMAFDESGDLIGSTLQIVNYSRSSFEATILLDPTANGPARSGRVVWEGPLKIPPRQVELLFDTGSVPVGEDARFILPEYDSAALHALEVSVSFADGSTSIASLTLGGEYVDQTTSALTAVPVTSRFNDPWSAGQVRNWLVRDGKPMEVFTVTAPPGILAVLRDDRLERSIRATIPWRDRLIQMPFQSAGTSNYQVIATSARPMADSPGTFRLSNPVDVSPRYGLRRVLLHEGPLVRPKGVDGQVLVKKGQKLWDSLAVAGLNVTRKNTPRLVVLMIASKLEDESRLAVPQALEYLASIHVPLMVWAPNKKALATYGLAQHERVYIGPVGLEELEVDVGRELGSQTIVWVKGQPLPTEISLSATAPADVSLVE